jgi:hypothetical protein
MFCLSGLSFTSMIHTHSWPWPYFYSHLLEDFRVIFCFRGEKFDNKEQVVPVEAASMYSSCNRIRFIRTQL